MRVIRHRRGGAWEVIAHMPGEDNRRFVMLIRARMNMNREPVSRHARRWK